MTHDQYLSHVGRPKLAELHPDLVNERTLVSLDAATAVWLHEALAITSEEGATAEMCKSREYLAEAYRAIMTTDKILKSGVSMAELDELIEFSYEMSAD